MFKTYFQEEITPFRLLPVNTMLTKFFFPTFLSFLPSLPLIDLVSASVDQLLPYLLYQNDQSTFTD